MKKLRESTKIILGMVIGLILSTASYVLADSIIDSKNVFYKDNSGLAVNNVQDAIDGTCTKFEKKIDTFLDKVYPVGSVYISTTLDTPEKVKTAIGGTWEAYGKGQTLVGVDTSQNEFKTVNTTGGAKSVSYTPKGTIGSTGLNINQIPSHTHDIGHTHTTPKTNTTTMSLTAKEAGLHQHDVISVHGNLYTDFLQEAGNRTTVMTAGWFQATSYANPFHTDSSGKHTHDVTGTVTVPAMTTNSISTTSSGAAGKGTISDGHTHSFTGTADSINNLQPYITVYMYKRTA